MAVQSEMVPLGSRAREFELPNVNPMVDADTVSLEDVSEGKDATLVMFICNHCPYVKNIRPMLAAVTRELMDRNVGVVGISSNDPAQYPDDSPEAMAREAETFGYPFPYLFDETQEVAKDFKAMCTPDLFLYDRDLELAYRGQFDRSRPSNDVEPTGRDLREAVEAVLTGQRIPADAQVPSQGCSIKWREGNEPDYFGI